MRQSCYPYNFHVFSLQNSIWSRYGVMKNMHDCDKLFPKVEEIIIVSSGFESRLLEPEEELKGNCSELVQRDFSGFFYPWFKL